MDQKQEQSIIECLESIAYELKAIKLLMGATWREKYIDDGTSRGITPELFTEEFITIEECAKRLNMSEEKIQELILLGNRYPERGWTMGIHYIIVPTEAKKTVFRIPWNSLVASFAKTDKNLDINSFAKTPRLKYGSKRAVLENVPGVFEEATVKTKIKEKKKEE